MSVLSAILALFVLVLRVMLLGLLLSPRVAGTRAPGADLLPRTGRALFAGVVANLLIPVALVAGRWTVLFDWVWWLIVVAHAVRWRVHRRELVPADLRHWLAPALLVLAAAALVLLLPARSEWRMGGWDPGHYQNNSVRIALGGRLENDASRLYAYLSLEERDLLMTRSYGGTYRAIADNLPVDPDGSLPLYFFHLTSLAGAGLHRLGGDAFLDRLNGFLAFGALFAFAALLSSLGLRGYRRALPLFFMVLSPLWWYHQNIPTSEMLYLFLLLGGAADWLGSRDARRPPWGAWTACFLLVLNHLNSAVLVTGLVTLATLLETAAADTPLPRRDRLVRAAVAFAAMALGIVWNECFAATTMLKLHDESGLDRFILRVFALGSAAGLLFAAVPVPRILRRPAEWALRAAGLLAGVVLAAVALSSLSGPARDWYYSIYECGWRIGPMLWWLMRQSPFYGIPAAVLAGLGLLLLSLSRDSRNRRLSLAVLAFAGVFVVTLYNPGIPKIFPWALRRFYAYSLPAFAMAQAAAVIWALDASCRKPKRTPFARDAATVILAAFICVVLLTLPTIRAAARAGDYPGLHAVISTLSAAMRPGDILVADAPSWLTPFLVGEGRDVVNGECLRDDDPGRRAAVRALVDALPARTGHRLLWLTTTTDGLSVYPEPPAVDPAPLVSLDYPATTVVHGQRNKYYSTETRTIPLRLYQGLP